MTNFKIMEIIRVCYVFIATSLICESSMKVAGCPDNCVSCLEDSNRCQRCGEGYFLQINRCQPCPYRCATCSNLTHCIKCKTDYWNIDYNCNSQCFVDCDGSGCDEKTGFCNRCPSGLYGKYCSQNCTHCKENSCELHQCTNGCDAGYFEFISEGYTNCRSCRDKSARCENRPICLECEKGFFKYNDSKRDFVLCLSCPPNCEECNKYTDCTVCIPGKYGSQCEINCSFSNCHRCSKSHGVEMCTECNSGYKLIANVCVPCENQNRACLSECPNGYWGIHCNKLCYEGCSSIHCKQTNASCNTCHRNYYGNACQFTCSDYCVNDSSLQQICTKSDGICELGCIAGYSDDRCNIAPASKLATTHSLVKIKSTSAKRNYGKITEQTTSSGNLETITEKNYENNINNEAENQSTFLLSGVMAGVGVIITIIVVVIIVCIVQKRRQGRLEREREYVNLTEMSIATISDTARGLETYEHSERTTTTSENVYAKIEDQLRDSQHYYSGLEITTD